MALNRIKQAASIDASGRIVLGAASPGASAIVFSTNWDDSENLNTYIIDPDEGGMTSVFPYVLTDQSGNYEVGTVQFELSGGTAETRQIWESNIPSGGFSKGASGLTFSIVQSAQSSVAVMPKLTSDGVENDGAAGRGPRVFGPGGIAVGDEAGAGQESVAVGGYASGARNTVVGISSQNNGNWVDHGAVVVGSNCSATYGMSTLVGDGLIVNKPGGIAVGNAALPRRLSFPVSMLVPAVTPTVLRDLSGDDATFGLTYGPYTARNKGYCERVTARFFIQSSSLQDGSFASVARMEPAIYVFGDRDAYPGAEGQFVVDGAFVFEHTGVNAPTATFSFVKELVGLGEIARISVTSSGACRITGIIDIEYLAIDLDAISPPPVIPAAPLPALIA